MTNKQKTIADAPAMLNTNDKAMWVIGWNECLAAHEQARVVGEPVAYLVTGPYEKVAFADFGSASSFCKGLNKGFGEAAYSVSPLYASPPAPQEAQAIKPPEALEALKAAFAADPNYAWSWHCAAWSSAYDEGMETGAANRAAARFMHMAFDVDTSKNQNFKPEHRVAAPVAQAATEQAEAPIDADPLTPEQEEWVMDLAEKHSLGRRVPQIGAMRGVAPDVLYTDASYRTHELFCFAAELLSTKEQS